MTVAEWVLMRQLLETDALAPSRLAERMGMTRGAVTKLADRLIAKSLLTRAADPDDGRAQTLALTAKGRRLVPELAALADANDREFFDHLAPKDRAALLRILRAMVERAWPQIPPPSIEGPDMTEDRKAIARATLEGSETGAMTFPESLRVLMDAGFDGYAVDLRRSTRIYYMPDGEALELETERTPTPVAERFDTALVREAIREAQALVPGLHLQRLLRQGRGCGLFRLPRFPLRPAGALSRPQRRDPHRTFPGHDAVKAARLRAQCDCD